MGGGGGVGAFSSGVAFSPFQVQGLSATMNSSEEAKQIRSTAKDMVEALRQSIHIIKDSELAEGGPPSGQGSMERTPPRDEDAISGGHLEEGALVSRVQGSPPRAAGNSGDNR